MPGHVAVVPLVYAEEPQEVGGHLVRRSGPLALPEKCVEVVRFAEDRPLADVKTLGQRLEM